MVSIPEQDFAVQQTHALPRKFCCDMPVLHTTQRCYTSGAVQHCCYTRNTFHASSGRTLRSCMRTLMMPRKLPDDSVELVSLLDM